MSQENTRESGQPITGSGRKHGWIIGAVVVVVILILPTLPGLYFYHFHPHQVISPEMRASFSLANEAARLGKLLALPEGPGNGAEDLWEASHHSMCGMNYPCQSALPADFSKLSEWDKEKRKITWEWLNSDQPQDREKLKEWSHLPEVDIFRRAAGKKDFKLIGTVVFPTPGVHPMEMPIPYYLDYPRLAGLGVIRSRELEAQGNTQEALGWLQDMIRIAHQMEKDILISQMVGISINLVVSEEIAKFYERQGQPQPAQAWKDYRAATEKRQALYREMIKAFPFYSEADARKIVEDPKIFTSFRNEFHMFLAMRMCYADPWRFYFGPTASDLKYLFADRSEDPLFIIMQLICAPEVEAGFCHRLHSGLRMYGYTFMQKPEPAK